MSDETSLSDKKISRQTISISPALREEIIKYINKKHKKNPEDSRYKSVSAFFTYVMEKALKILKEGKTFNDLEEIPHKDIRNFFDQITFKGIIPFIEANMSMNKYIPPKFDNNPEIYLKARKLLKQEKADSKHGLIELLNKFGKYLISNKITRTFDLELKGDIYYLEFIGNYKNLHFNGVKFLTGIFGFLGLKINKIIYSEKEMYARFNFEIIPLFNKSKLLLRKRKKVAKKNIKQFINYARIVNDDSRYLWLKAASDKNIALKFKDRQTIEEWFSKVKKDIEKFSPSRKLKAKSILNFFENIHWITIINEEDLVFEFTVTSEEYQKEREFLLKKLSDYGEIKNRKEIYQLKIR